MRTDVLGVGFDAVTMDRAVARALELMREGRGAYVCTPNPEMVLLARKDEGLRAAINGADLVAPDGVGIVWAAKTLGRPLPERVPGIDLMTALLGRMEGRVYLLGGRPGVAAEAAEAIRAAYPRVTVAGWADGYFTDEAPVARALRAASADLVIVCLGSPKQERFMAAHRDLPVGLMIGLGGALDVLAGRAKRAPESWRRRGLEWLWRLLREPKRLKRQIRLPGFVLAVRKQRKQECKKED